MNSNLLQNNTVKSVVASSITMGGLGLAMGLAPRTTMGIMAAAAGLMYARSPKDLDDWAQARRAKQDNAG